MAYPTEFRTNEKVIGPTGIKHPKYVFQVNLQTPKNEAIGPITNSRTTAMLSPFMTVSSPDQGRVMLTAQDVQKSAWLTGLFSGGNIDINNDGTITAYGQQGVYLKNTYTVGLNPILTLINSPPYTA